MVIKEQINQQLDTTNSRTSNLTREKLWPVSLIRFENHSKSLSPVSKNAIKKGLTH